MNIYSEFCKVNASHPLKTAASKRFADGRLETCTYGEMTEKISRYAEELVRAGLTGGDRIAILSEGMPEWPAAFLAVCRISCTAVLIDVSLNAPEILDLIERSDVRAIFISAACKAKFEDLSMLRLPVFDIYSGQLCDGPERVPADLPATADKDEEVAAILFSSGTTRRAAGVMHRHDALIETTRMTLKVQGLGSDDRYLAIIPDSHIYGVICLVLGPILSGADVRYIDGISSDAVFNAFSDYHPTVLPAVPKVYELFMTGIMRKINANVFTKAMFAVFFPICLKIRRKNGSLPGKKIFAEVHRGFGGSLKYLCSAGAPLKREIAEFYYGLGFDIIITYGATETNIPTIGNVPGRLTTDSCGSPYPGIEAEISASGELLIRSPYRMKGYFRDEEATKAALTEDGWFRTGDLARVNDKGFYQITGRCKENIVLDSGKKVAPDDIEEQYSGIDGVKEFAVCGVPAEGADYDDVHAFIVPSQDTESSRILIRERFRQAGSRLPSYMKIDNLHFVDRILRTSLQKPKRYLLRKSALDERVSENAPAYRGPSHNDDRFTVAAKIIAAAAHVDAGRITEETKIPGDLAIDSIEMIDIALQMEETFGVDIEPYFSRDMTVGSLLEAIEGKSVIKSDCTEYPLEKRGWDRFLFSAARGLARLLYRIRCTGIGNLNIETGFILCANHVTNLDFLFLAAVLPKGRCEKICCMAKKELFKDSFFSRSLVRAAGMVPIDRSGLNLRALSALDEKLRENWCVFIHPEGTRSADGVFRNIRNGAAALAIEAQVPVVTAYIDGVYDIFPRSIKLPRLFDWKHCRRYRINIIFGRSIPSAGADVEILTEEIRSAILDLAQQAGR
jgi:long-chain acyl-CoA synthetase